MWAGREIKMAAMVDKQRACSFTILWPPICSKSLATHIPG